MRRTLDIDDDVFAAIQELARVEGRSVGAVVSDLVRRELLPAGVGREHGRPVIRAPAGAPPITPETIRRALGED